MIPAGLGRQPGLHIDFCTFAQGTCSDDFECAIIQGAGKEARYAMSKAADAFRTISEVADDLEVPKHVLRFWENRFPQIKPMKRGGGRRYYRPADLELLRGIRHLLHTEGYTIKGVQKILREQGVEIVKACWLPGRGLRDAAGGRKGTAGREAEVVVSPSGLSGSRGTHRAHVKSSGAHRGRPTLSRSRRDHLRLVRGRGLPCGLLSPTSAHVPSGRSRGVQQGRRLDVRR